MQMMLKIKPKIHDLFSTNKYMHDINENDNEKKEAERHEENKHARVGFVCVLWVD